MESRSARRIGVGFEVFVLADFDGLKEVGGV